MSTRTIEVSAVLIDVCHSDYLLSHAPTLVGVPIYGQDRSKMADDVLAELPSYDCGNVPPDVMDDAIRAAVIDCLTPTAKFWPVDDEGNEVTDPEATNHVDCPDCRAARRSRYLGPSDTGGVSPLECDKLHIQDEQPCAWFRLTFFDAETGEEIETEDY